MDGATYYRVDSGGFQNFCTAVSLRALLEKMDSIRQVYQIIEISQHAYNCGVAALETSKSSIHGMS